MLAEFTHEGTYVHVYVVVHLALLRHAARDATERGFCIICTTDVVHLYYRCSSIAAFNRTIPCRAHGWLCGIVVWWVLNQCSLAWSAPKPSTRGGGVHTFLSAVFGQGWRVRLFLVKRREIHAPHHDTVTVSQGVSIQTRLTCCDRYRRQENQQ